MVESPTCIGSFSWVVEVQVHDTLTFSIYKSDLPVLKIKNSPFISEPRGIFPLFKNFSLTDTVVKSRLLFDNDLWSTIFSRIA